MKPSLLGKTVIGLITCGWSRSMFLILSYGICVDLTGICCTRSFFVFAIIEYSVFKGILQSLFAQFPGVALRIGRLAQIFYAASPKGRTADPVLFSLVIGMCVLLGLLENNLGFLQQLL